MVKSEHNTSSTTLDILSKYCGFSSFDELLRLKNNKQGNRNANYPNNILNYLISIFRESPISEYEDKTFNCIVKETIIFLDHHPELTDKFQKAVSKTKNGQDFYFEQFINIDKLNSFYGEGLLYYLAKKKQ